MTAAKKPWKPTPAELAALDVYEHEVYLATRRVVLRLDGLLLPPTSRTVRAARAALRRAETRA